MEIDAYSYKLCRRMALCSADAEWGQSQRVDTGYRDNLIKKDNRLISEYYYPSISAIDHMRQANIADYYVCIEHIFIDRTSRYCLEVD